MLDLLIQKLLCFSFLIWSVCCCLQLLGELLASAPKDVLEAQAGPAGATACADPAQWLRWWKEARSWSAGYTFGQWLQVGHYGMCLCWHVPKADFCALLGTRCAVRV